MKWSTSFFHPTVLLGLQALSLASLSIASRIFCVEGDAACCASFPALSFLALAVPFVRGVIRLQIINHGKSVKGETRNLPT